MKYKVTVFILLVFGCSAFAKKTSFDEMISVYGVIKPGKMTNLIAVNNGMVSKIPFHVGQKIKFGQVALSAIERETTRGYRSTISGRIAKLHVNVGAAVTPGMPLVTIIDPEEKLVEVTLSPKEGRQIQEGSQVFRNGKVFGKILSISPLVDPDTGGVLSYVAADENIDVLIGDVIPLKIVSRTIEGCKTVDVSEVDNFLDEYRVEATSGNSVCLMKKNEKE